MAAAPAPAQSKKGASLAVQGGILVGLTLAAAAMGWFGGGTIKPAAPVGAETSAPHPASQAGVEPVCETCTEGAHAGGAAPAAVLPGQLSVVALAPITTNLAAPSDTWVRMELSLGFSEALEPGMAETITQDILAYLRTLKLHQLQGPSSFLHLQADLEERARIRSEGKVARVFVRTMILE